VFAKIPSIIKSNICVIYATESKNVMQKSDENEDLRVRRTRKLLQEAMIQLTVEKGFKAVTVRDITERAMVNRSTFYRHYIDKCDLVERYMDDVYALISEDSVEPGTFDQPNERPPSGLLRLLKHVQQYADFYRVMLGENGDPGFIASFRNNVEKRFRYMISVSQPTIDTNGPPLDLRLSYISYADIGAILWWLENDQPISLEQLAIWIGRLSSSSAGITEWPNRKQA
jgi:AcrR family transcriptional regulator